MTINDSNQSLKALGHNGFDSTASTDAKPGDEWLSD